MYQPTSKAHGKQELTPGVGFTAGSTACHFTSLSAYLPSKWSCVPTGLANVSQILLQKVLEKNSVGFCAKNQFTRQQPWPQHVLPLAGLVLGIITACTWAHGLCLHKACKRKLTWDWPQKYTGIQQHLTCTVSKPSGARKSFCTVFVFYKIKITCLLRYTSFKAEGSWETIPYILH